MKPARSFFSLIALSSVLAAQSVEPPKLAIEFAPYLVNLHVGSVHDTFLGVAILSFEPDLAHYFQGLPPLLANHVVAGFGLGEGGSYVCSVDEFALPAGIAIYAQGVTFDGVVFEATGVRDFVLDVTVPK